MSGSGLKVGASRFGSFSSSVVLIAAFCLMTIQTEVAGSRGGTANVAAAKATFRAKCVMCHGPDGAGSEVGKSLNIPDLRSSTVQKTPEPELAEIIANGKNGMPSFKGSLDAGQIHGLVAYIRTFATKK